MTQYILALDQGTTSTRAIIFDEEESFLCVPHKKRLHKFFYSRVGIFTA